MTPIIQKRGNDLKKKPRKTKRKYTLSKRKESTVAEGKKNEVKIRNDIPKNCTSDMDDNLKKR